ncbi:MAG: ABC transporter ATP-binding protein [Candidatus Methanomethylicia archaeon]|nr:ABC transporter ATP-binding protein [Candidatus Methanomethylicia archaeon]MCX8168940.1 ABC transporter ATP-binding protein [Candidatus Methanomethylicia archaeon]MDW7988672.1 ABC transporter ATP-binding protein [Nitrososphaerota archaeon]
MDLEVTSISRYEIVRLENVSKVYVAGKIKYPALKGISTLFYKGEFTAIMGPSGSGKSTLLNLIGGLDKPTEGRIIVCGKNLEHMSSDELAEYRNEKVGFVFQLFNLIGYLNAIENVMLPMAIKKVDFKERKEKAMKILKMLGLEDKINKKPNELSGGERQRVAIARALVNDPELILADEPTGNVDSENAKIIINAFRKLVDENGITVIMVTHNIELSRFCDRVLILRDGIIEREEVIRK